jgi:hypothetical protein
MIDLARYLNQTITLGTRSAYDKYGKSTTSTTSILARTVYTNRQTRGLQAKPIDWDLEVWIYPTVTVAVDDTVTVDTIVFRIIEVQTLRDRLGNVHHKKLLCQKYV